MEEPGVTRAGPVGRKLAVGSHTVLAGAAICLAGRCAPWGELTAADPGTIHVAAATASSSTVGSFAQAGGFTGTPPAVC
jgi:hypothetical protein